MLRCQAPKRKDALGLGGERCGAEAVYRTKLGQPVCEACGLELRAAHEAGETLLSMLHPGTSFPLEPIQ